MAYKMTARRRAALKKAQLASARKRSRNRRINKKIHRVTKRTNRKIARANTTIYSNIYTNSKGEIFTNRKGVRAHNRGNKALIRGQAKAAKLRAKKY